MSLLESILSKKGKLKNTKTVVTTPDGRKFLEVSSDSHNRTELKSNSFGYVIDTKPDNIPSKIVEFMYLGSQDCCEEKVLTSYNIKYVLSVGIEAPIKYPKINYKFIECLDLPESNLKIVLEKCIPFINNAVVNHENVLIHCNAGVSRAASVVIGYLILYSGCCYAEAIKIVKNARGCIKPNSGFERQLQCL